MHSLRFVRCFTRNAWAQPYSRWLPQFERGPVQKAYTVESNLLFSAFRPLNIAPTACRASLVAVMNTKRVLARAVVIYASPCTAWKILKDIHSSAARKSARISSKRCLFLSVQQTALRGFCGKEPPTP